MGTKSGNFTHGQQHCINGIVGERVDEVDGIQSQSHGWESQLWWLRLCGPKQVSEITRHLSMMEKIIPK